MVYHTETTAQSDNWHEVQTFCSSLFFSGYGDSEIPGQFRHQGLTDGDKSGQARRYLAVNTPYQTLASHKPEHSLYATTHHPRQRINKVTRSCGNEGDRRARIICLISETISFMHPDSRRLTHPKFSSKQAPVRPDKRCQQPDLPGGYLLADIDLELDSLYHHVAVVSRHESDLF